MTVLHVIPSLSPKQGGPSQALPLIARSVLPHQVKVDVATTDDDGPGARVAGPLETPLIQDGLTFFYFRKQTEFYKYSRSFRTWLAREAEKYDLIHIHALFSYTSVCAANLARQRGIPYIIRPLGVLNRWGMRNRRRVLKTLSFAFIERPLLKHAAAIHYTSEQERIEAEQAGATTPAFVAPLGLDLASFQQARDSRAFCARWPQARGRDIILFLSRLDRKKGLELLIDAFGTVAAKFPNALLVVAGEGSPEYKQTLLRRAEAFDISEKILWTGFLEGARKSEALAAARAFVLPSYSENFGIAAVEALAAAVPVIISTGVGISGTVSDAEAGVVVPPESAAVSVALECLLSNPDLARRLAENGRKLAADRYSLESMGKSLVELYRTVLRTARTKPSK